MKHPAYHLRENKAIDRFLLVEIIDILKRHCDISDYTYYGFGGPFLEDCKLIHDRCPEIPIVSIEKNEQTFKRQEFHCFSKKLDLRRKDFASFLAHFSSSGKEIFWLDYTDLKFGNFDEFMNILGKVSENSVVKITIRAEPPSKELTEELAPEEREKKLEEKWENFQREYNQILPASAKQANIERPVPFINLLQKMLEIAAQQVFRESESVFQPLNSSYYDDQTQMLSVTGIVCKKNKVAKIRQWFKSWRFINLTWAEPHSIDVPILSTKERLHLAKYLPTTKRTGLSLSRALGYKIDNTGKKHIEKLRQYEEFYQYYPYFARVLI